MKISMKLLGVAAILAVAIPVSAYAATQAPATTSTPAPAVATPAPAVVTPAPAVEAPGTEVADATEAPGTEVADATEAPGTEVADATEKESKTPEAVDPNEQAKLQQAAKITQQQATDAALKQVNGTVKKVELEDENGVVVYGVEITDATGKTFDVKVDAASGVVTKSDNGDNENN
jgi:uncharacterized membrane protein YkoI